MLSKSITRQENHPQRKTEQPRYVMAHRQASQIRKYAATQRYSDNQSSGDLSSVTILQTLLERIARATS